MSEGRLLEQMREQSAQVRGLLISVSALANQTRSMSLPVAAQEAVLGMRVELACAVAALDASLGAVSMTGEEPWTGNLERERMLRSLHRAGDHTLDPDETDRNVTVCPAAKETEALMS
jgi:hypothetical protein